MGDYDDKYGCRRDNIYTAPVLQKYFAKSSFGPLQLRSSSVFLKRGDEIFYWIAQVLLLVYVKSDNVAESGAELALVQYFEVAPPEDEIDRGLNCGIFNCESEDKMNHSINFNPRHSGMVEAGEWYVVVPFPSIVSVHDISLANYSVTPYCPKIPWPAYTFCVNIFHQNRASKLNIYLHINFYGASKISIEPNFSYIAILS